MKEQLQVILAEKLITTVFQPIYNVDREIVAGYEALTRGPKNSALYAPDILFEQATAHGLLSELELLCRASAITRFADLNLQGKLFINVSPAVMLNKDHPNGETIKLVEQAGLSCQQVVIEISEKYPFPNNNLLRNALDKYRQFGFDVAIDDLGAGYSGLKQWSYLRPDIVKIDRYFIDQCDKDVMKREFLRTLFDLGKTSNAHVIAEGIETKEEFELLRELGMVYAQGFFLAHPSEFPPTDYPSLNVNSTYLDEPYLGTVAVLASAAITVNYDQSANYIYQLFTDNNNVHAIPVLDGLKPVGMIYRNELMELYSDIYGRSLFSKKSALEIMDHKPLMLEHTMPLEQVSALLTARENLEFTHSFIAVENGLFSGLVSARDLLKSITDSKLEQARYANPLTGLPGNVMIEKEIDHMLFKQQSFHLAYLDLNFFKPFNDIYGYAKGDLLLKALANSIVINANNNNCFVGHIGGDDFIVMFKNDNVKTVCEAILADFAKQSLTFLTQEHIDQQGYYSLNRRGERVFHPLVSLAIGAIKPDICSYSSYHQIADLASKAKLEAKKVSGNNLFICRRSNLERNNMDLFENKTEVA
ncbi:MAG: GGDEF domain-containing protein [Alteromonadaceae bacterium]|nr:GGDEF domain-containing protein [Alteromonadaceae bacterium]